MTKYVYKWRAFEKKGVDGILNYFPVDVALIKVYSLLTTWLLPQLLSWKIVCKDDIEIEKKVQKQLLQTTS